MCKQKFDTCTVAQILVLFTMYKQILWLVNTGQFMFLTKS